MLSKCMATPRILSANYATLSITSSFPYPKLCEALHNKGQMEFYLKWLDRYDRYEGENAPIGLILCAKAHRGQIELLELDKSGIAVAEYWTVLPPKAEFERKIREILAEAKERLDRRNLLTDDADSNVKREIDYFYEPKDEDDE